MHSLRVSLHAVLFLSLATASSFPADPVPTLSPQWILGDDARRIAQVPLVRWLEDGTAILYDTSRPTAERTFERLDPVSGRRWILLDSKQALRSLHMVLKNAAEWSALPWPDDFNGSGTKGLYVIEGNLFVLDIRSATFSRLTSSAQEETCATFSPNGRLVAFVRHNDLYVYDLEQRTETRLTYNGSEALLNGTLSWVYGEEIFGSQSAGYWWSPDSRAIAFLRTDDSPVPVSTFVDFAGDGRRTIHQRYPLAGEPNPKARVGIVELGSKRTHWVTLQKKPYEWVVGVKWLSDPRRLSVQTINRLQTRLDLYFADRRTGRATLILTEEDSTWVNDRYDHLYFPDSKSFLWSSERDGYLRLYWYTLDGKLQNRVTGDDAPNRESIVGADAKGGWVYFTGLGKTSTERSFYRTRFDGSGLTKLSQEVGWHSVVMSPDSHYYVDRFSNIHTPPAISLHSSDGKPIQVIAAARTQLVPEGIQYPELITIPATDGFPMPAQILRPRDFDPARRYPVILYIYGGPSAPAVVDTWQSDNVIPGLLFNNMMAADGYIMVAIDDRAATGISKKLEDMMAKDPVASETADWLAGVRWLKSQPWVDGSRIGVWGWSGGGTNTLNLMTHSKEFKAGIAVAPVTDIRYYDSKFAEWIFKLPQDHPDAYDRASPLKHAADLSGRLLLIYGTYDDNVHPQNEEAFIDALVKAGKYFDLMIYPMRKHDISDRAAKIHLYEQMREFWKSHL
jgi:dipeptidyl-peptidase-4